MVGYAIGALLYDSIGLVADAHLQWPDRQGRRPSAQSYAEWGAVIILLKGLTPIPYKLVTITSGFAGYNIWLFILCSIVARGGRFFVLAVLLNRYGDLIRTELEKRLGTVGRDRSRGAGARILHCLQADLTRSALPILRLRLRSPTCLTEPAIS